MSALKRFSIAGVFAALATAASVALAPLARAEDIGSVQNLHHFERVEYRQHDGVTQLWVRNGDRAAYLGDLGKTEPGMKFFHWTTAENVRRWSAKGGISRGEFNVLASGGGQAAGGGVYVSSHSIDSWGYGPRAAVFELPAGVRTLKIERVTLLDGQWTELHALLRKEKIGLISYNGNWNNVIDPALVTRTRAATLEDFYRSANFNDGRAPSLPELLQLDARYPLKSDPWLTQHAPALARIVAGEEPPPAVAEELYEKGIKPVIESAFGPEVFAASPIVGRLKALFHDRLVEFYRQGFERIVYENREVNLYSSKDFEEKVRAAYLMGVKPEELGFSFARPIPGYHPPEGAVPFDKAPEVNAYGEELSAAFDLLGHDEVASRIARGEELPRYAAVLKKLRANAGKLEEAYEVLYGRKLREGLRDLPVEHPESPMSAEELSALERNPYLTVRHRPDPEHEGRFLVSYEHPSARTWAKFSDRLPPHLARELSDAEKAGVFRDMSSPEARSLTRRLLESLVSMSGGGAPSAAWKYQELMGLLPLASGNETLGKAFYFGAAYKSFWLHDESRLLRTPPELLLMESELGALELRRIRAAMEEETVRNPAYPHYHELPELRAMTDRAGCALGYVRRLIAR